MEQLPRMRRWKVNQNIGRVKVTIAPGATFYEEEETGKVVEMSPTKISVAFHNGTTVKFSELVKAYETLEDQKGA